MMAAVFIVPPHLTRTLSKAGTMEDKEKQEGFFSPASSLLVPVLPLLPSGGSTVRSRWMLGQGSNARNSVAPMLCYGHPPPLPPPLLGSPPPSPFPF